MARDDNPTHDEVMVEKWQFNITQNRMESVNHILMKQSQDKSVKEEEVLAYQIHSMHE